MIGSPGAIILYVLVTFTPRPHPNPVISTAKISAPLSMSKWVKLTKHSNKGHMSGVISVPPSLRPRSIHYIHEMSMILGLHPYFFWLRLPENTCSSPKPATSVTLE